MLPSDVKLYSVDDHVIEPPNMWLDRLPSKYHAVAPRVVRAADGTDEWHYEQQVVKIERGVTRTLPEYAGEDSMYTSYEQMRPSCYDAAARLEDMDIERLFAQVAFPNFARFAGHRFLPTTDPHLSLLCVQAYNDFIIDEWAGTDRDRLLPLAILPLWDASLAAAELERVASKGARAIAFSENPSTLGLPSVHTDHWEPVWTVANEVGLPICMHIGSSSKHYTTSPDAPATVMLTLVGVNAMMACADWTFSGIFDRHPSIRIVLSEGGAGWAPYLVERADKIHNHFMAQVEGDGRPAMGLGGDRLPRPPSEVFREHIYVCMISEMFAVRSLDSLPVDNLLWETDFPHMDSLWPHSRKFLEEALTDVPDEDARKVGELNARRLFAP